MISMAKVAAITGAYKGLGASLSMALAGKGYKLALVGRDRKELERFAAGIKNTDVLPVVADVRKKKDCERIVNAAVRRFGRLDLLVNNAGVWKSAKIDDAKEEDIREMFEVNVFGPIYCSQAAVRVMRRQGSGHILNIGSTSAVDNKSSHVAYGSSKAALIGFTGCLGKELEGTGIRVSVFSPGGMKTHLFRSRPERMGDDFMDPDFVAKRIIRHIENPGNKWHVVLRIPQ